MKSFFVPVFMKLGKFDEEKIMVALIGVTPQKIYVKYSPKRIQLSSQILGPGYSILAKEVLEQIQSKASQVNSILSKSDEIKYDGIHVFNEDYFDYLKKYCQNTLLFGNVEKVNPLVSFDSLFSSLMNEKPEEVKSVKTSFHKIIKDKLTATGVGEKADIEYKIKPEQLPGLYNDMTVTLISKNGGIIAAEAIDFNIGMAPLSNALNAFEVLTNSLKVFSKKHKLYAGKYHILNSIPPSGSEQEKLLNNIYKHKKELYKITPADCINEITEEINKGEYCKFSTAYGS